MIEFTGSYHKKNLELKEFVNFGLSPCSVKNTICDIISFHSLPQKLLKFRVNSNSTMLVKLTLTNNRNKNKMFFKYILSTTNWHLPSITRSKLCASCNCWLLPPLKGVQVESWGTPAPGKTGRTDLQIDILWTNSCIVNQFLYLLLI